MIREPVEEVEVVGEGVEMRVLVGEGGLLCSPIILMEATGVKTFCDCHWQ